MNVFCGIDWDLLALLGEHGDSVDAPIPVAIETGRGLLVAALRATRPVYVINPMAAARYRECWTVSRSKSDAADAVMLANVRRTDAHAHRPLPADSELVRAIAVLARAGQDAAWATQQLANQLRSVLREFFPGALAAFQVKHVGLASVEARAVLAAAPTPTAAARLSIRRLEALLRRAGRQRNLRMWAERLHAAFATEQLHHDPLIERAFGEQVRALVLQIDAAARSTAQLLEATEAAFRQHPDADIITSFPGVGTITGARILAELGDDKHRFADARALKAYAGAAPVTRASGRSHVVMHRRVKNNRLASAGYIWAFAALSASPAARAFYDQRRAHGDRHAAALRRLFNRNLGQLHHCLQTRASYDETRAYPAFTATVDDDAKAA